MLNSFHRNGHLNQAHLAALAPAELAFSDGRGGWLGTLSSKHAQDLKALHVGAQTEQEPRAQALAAAFQAGDEAALRAVQDAIKSPQPFADPYTKGTYLTHPAHFLQHVIVQDSHYRGR